MQTEVKEKVDLVELAERIKFTTAEFNRNRFRMHKKERKIIRKSINQLIRQYNETIGKNLITEL